jgi:hypothetical protein
MSVVVATATFGGVGDAEENPKSTGCGRPAAIV